MKLPRFTKKCHGRHGVNSNQLFNGDDLSIKGARSCRGWRAHSKTGGLALKYGSTASELAKNNGRGGIFNGLHRLHHSSSGAETLVVWSSAAPLPRRQACVLLRRRGGDQTAR